MKLMFTFGYKSKFSAILRALAAIAIGLVMVIGNDASVTVVRVIAAFLCAAGLVSLFHAYSLKEAEGRPLVVTNAAVDIILGLVLFFFPQLIAGFIVFIAGAALLVLGLLQLLVMIGVVRFMGHRPLSLLFSLLAIIGAVILLTSPFAKGTMTILAGVFLIIYGASELWSSFRVEKAKKAYEIKFPSKGPSKGPAPESLEGVKEAEFTKME